MPIQLIIDAYRTETVYADRNDSRKTVLPHDQILTPRHWVRNVAKRLKLMLTKNNIDYKQDTRMCCGRTSARRRNFRRYRLSRLYHVTKVLSSSKVSIFVVFMVIPGKSMPLALSLYLAPHHLVETSRQEYSAG